MKLLIKTEFKRNLRSWFLWSSIIIGLTILEITLFPAFKDSISNLIDMMSTFPDSFLELFGLNQGGLDLTTAYGWFGMEGYLFMLLIGGSYAGILGSGILSKEEDDKTIEFLLSKPISRNQVLLGKAIVVLINITLLNVILFGIMSFIFASITDYEFVTTLFICIGPFLLEIMFAAIAMFIGVFMTKSRSVMSTSLGLVMGLYFVEIIATVTNKLDFLKYFSPYEYVNAVSVVKDHSIKPLYLLIMLGVMLISAVGTWFFYNRKDISV
ncbi:MAG: ABC transporter permease [Bacilli bacterium]|nr:ABC transporter permease [Bacilli bacterium]MBN2876379.1 ABC transporter permease [Bacilli bacterium]